MKEFKPTYLCIKQHLITGKLYFCKTTKSEKQMLKYKGSGRYWARHLKEHGKEYIETIWFCLFYDKETIKEFALMCSEQWNIVKAVDEHNKKLWANERSENGLDGGAGSSGNRGANKGKKYKPKPDGWINLKKGISTIQKGIPSGRKGIKQGKRGPQTAEHIANRVAARKGKPNKKPSSLKGKSSKKKGIKIGLQEIVKCLYCPKLGGISNMKRWHFDNCKYKPINTQ